MASIFRKGNGWIAQIARQGYRRVSKQFPTKKAAQHWSQRVETQMAEGTYQDEKQLDATSVASILDRYACEIHAIKPFGRSKMASVRQLQRFFTDASVGDLNNKLLTTYASNRRQTVAGSTVVQELSYLGQALDIARDLWGLQMVHNPVKQAMPTLRLLKLTGATEERDRRPTTQEMALLLEATGHHWLNDFIRIAADSAMRQSEIHGLLWSDLDFENRTILVRQRKDPKNKEGNDQLIPMFDQTKAVLEALPRHGEKVFENPKTAPSVSDAFAKLTKRLEIDNLRFHDLRHEAVSRLFERGFSIEQVALVSGHKDWKQLKRYTNLKATDLV